MRTTPLNKLDLEKKIDEIKSLFNYPGNEVEDELISIIETIYSKGYDEGSENGHKEGYSIGYDEGHNIGYDIGYDTGVSNVEID